MTRTTPVFTGVAVALVTFFDEHGHVDTACTAKHAVHLAERGACGRSWWPARRARPRTSR